MNRITSIMVMHPRDRMSWVIGPWGIIGLGFVTCAFIALFLRVLLGHWVDGEVYTGASASIYIVMLIQGVFTINNTFPFAVGLGTRRRDFFLGTLTTSVITCAAWAIALGLLSLFEANVLKNWGVGLHFFHLPVFSDGALLRQFCWTTFCSTHGNPDYFTNRFPLPQFWVYFVLLFFMFQTGMLIGSVYQRFGRVGEYCFFGGVLALMSIFLLVSTSARWWGAIGGWFAMQTAASLGLWLMPVVACCVAASYALLRKVAV